jgi:hypothetical protein
MILNAGTVLYFKQYTGLEVSGRFICNGDSYEKVLFTSTNGTTSTMDSTTDSTSSTQFTQWNGIVIKDGGEIQLKRVEISNTVQGIQSYGSTCLEKVLFRNNSEDLTIKDSVIAVDSYTLFSGNFNCSVTQNLQNERGSDTLNAEPSITPITNNKNQWKKTKKNRKHWKLPVRLTLGATAIASAALVYYYHNEYHKALEKYNSSTKDATEKREEAEKYVLYRNIFVGTGSASVVGFTITLFF